MKYKPDIQFARDLNKDNEMLAYKEKFYQDDDRIYLVGNSLGLLSKSAEKEIMRALDEWREHGVEGWTKGEPAWFWYGEKLGDMTAPLIGAEPEETIVTGSTTLNIHQLLASFYQPEGRRKKILVDELNFPSDIYAVKSQLAQHGNESELVVVESRDGRTLEEEDIIAAFNDEIAIALLPTVLYQSGQLLDVKKLTEAAHEHGILIGFDLAHSVGILPHDLSGAGVDFALWCNYKYLNAGPGAVGGLYVNKKHFDRKPGLAGWWGHDKETQFEMSHEFTPAEDAGAMQISTLPILSSAPLFSSLDMINEIGIEKVREESLNRTSYLAYLMAEKLDTETVNYSIVTPEDDSRRGGHIAVKFEREAYRISKALKEAGVIVDFREPDTIRFAPSPLYISFEDLYNAVEILADIINQERFEEVTKERGSVT
ncbi:kynureninase [Halanaerobiaceae bacterium Z-7014]|uniref:Kynureninase n=1 Tax=Halonatronomonas betaini TaxID=2778430 RepID=A0A931F8Y6_9FIRM|nr:kynureninase [Halonatronomonas betaini]MBF8435854.1 kynureninase [Halonatronomonas betaini]